jgi:hypothetical protein
MSTCAALDMLGDTYEITVQDLQQAVRFSAGGGGGSRAQNAQRLRRL